MVRVREGAIVELLVFVGQLVDYLGKVCVPRLLQFGFVVDILSSTRVVGVFGVREHEKSTRVHCCVCALLCVRVCGPAAARRPGPPPTCTRTCGRSRLHALK